MPKFDLGDDKADIFTGKDVHFPVMTLPGHCEARLFDQAAVTQRHERFSIENRNWILNLKSTQICPLRLYSYRSFGLIRDANARGRALA